MKNELKHYGVLGMKWGVRRYQNKDGSLTSEGKRRLKRQKIIKVGASVVAGLLSSSFGAGGVYALTGSKTAASVLAPSLGVIGGMKYYEWINS